MSALRQTEASAGTLPGLAALGTRIAIIGPSGSGKSTLAAALAQRTAAACIHLDQLFHQPGTEWVPRPAGEFDRLHAEAIAGDAWVMDGNYSGHLAARLARATSVVWTALPVPICLFRYLRRSLARGPRPAGGLPGGSERIKWHMLRYIVLEQPKKVPTLQRIVGESGKPVILLRRAAQIRRAYEAWQIEVPRHPS